MVNLTRIYTRTGDAGATRLSDMSEARKTDARVAAYGDVDEANSVLGLVLVQPGLPDALAAALRTIQNELFDVGADLSTPVRPDPEWLPLRIEQPSIERFEAWCDEFAEGCPTCGPSSSRALGSPAGAHLHLARTVVRRAERSGWRAAEEHGWPRRPKRPPASSAGAHLPQPAVGPALHRLPARQRCGRRGASGARSRPGAGRRAGPPAAGEDHRPAGVGARTPQVRYPKPGGRRLEPGTAGPSCSPALSRPRRSLPRPSIGRRAADRRGWGARSPRRPGSRPRASARA